jgi:hypothetical protein
MGQTTAYQLPYPEATDPADVPLDMRELAERLDLLLPPLIHEVAADQATASGSYVDLATVGPTLTIPRAGDYIASFGVKFYGGTAGLHMWVAPKRGAAPTSDADALEGTTLTGLGSVNPAKSIRLNGLAAGDVVKLQYRASGTVSFVKRWLMLQLVRVT